MIYEKIPISGLGREEWLELRRSGIGGSDAAAVCGLNPYSSAMKVYYEKTEAPDDKTPGEAARQGTDLENYVALRFTEATGLKVRRSNYMLRSTENPFMVADVDRLIVGEDAGLECKTASAFSADKWKDGDIPVHYAVQCFHYMAVTGKKAWYLAAVILGREFVFRKLTYDADIIASIIKAEKNFWESFVLRRQLPPPDGSEACDELIKRYFGKAKKGPPVELMGFDGKLERHGEISRKIKELEAEQKRIEQEVKMVMADSELASSERFTVTWSNVESTRLDTKRIREEKPEIYSQYSKTCVSRRFTIRAA